MTLLKLSVFLLCSLFYFGGCYSINHAKMARYVVNQCDWISISTISTMKGIQGFPFVNLKSTSDGPLNNGSGIPYLYLSDYDLTAKDLKIDNRVTAMVTLAQTDYCKSKDLDSQDPRCVRVLLTGKVIKVEKNSAEEKFAQNALFSRHPAMKTWPLDHHFYYAKVDIQQIAVLDFFGGIKLVSKADYFNATQNSNNIRNNRHTIEVVQVIF